MISTPCGKRTNIASLLDSSQSQSISPRIDESSANLSNLVLRSLILQSFVYKVKRTGDSTQAWGAPVFVMIEFDLTLPYLTY